MWELSLLTRLRDTHFIIDQRKSALMGNFSTNCLKVEYNNSTNNSHRCLIFIDNITSEILATEEVVFNFLDYKVLASHWHSKTVVIQGVLKKMEAATSENIEVVELRQVSFDYFQIKDLFMSFLLHCNEDFDDDLLQDAI